MGLKGDYIMKKINKRKFMGMIGSSIIGLFTIGQLETKALNIKINAFQTSKSVNLQNVDTIQIKMKNIQIESRNVNDSEPAVLDIYGKIGDNDIGHINTLNLDIVQNQSVDFGPQTIDLKNGDRFQQEYLETETYLPSNSVNIKIIFELKHSDISTIKKEVDFNLGISTGRIVTSDFEYSPNNMREMNDIKPDSNLTTNITDNVLDAWYIESRFEKLKRLSSGGFVNNLSSYKTPKGVIDVISNKYDIGPRNMRELNTERPSDDLTTDINENTKLNCK